MDDFSYIQNIVIAFSEKHQLTFNRWVGGYVGMNARFGDMSVHYEVMKHDIERNIDTDVFKMYYNYVDSALANADYIPSYPQYIGWKFPNLKSENADISIGDWVMCERIDLFGIFRVSDIYQLQGIPVCKCVNGGIYDKGEVWTIDIQVGDLKKVAIKKIEQ